MNKPILECNNLYKRFGNKTILKDVSLKLYEEDILGFIGPNGAGKTTTIKLILGLQNITSGTVKINGFDIEKDFEKAIINVGAIIENPDSYMNLTGKENIKLAASYYEDCTEEKINEVIKLTKLEKRINDKVSKYSLGMRQRLGIALALLNNPKLLILDEPTNGLDPEGIKELRDLLTNLAKKEKIGILISSHNLSELETFCNKVCIIKNGQIVETSDVKSIKKNNDKNEYIINIDNIKNINKILSKYEVEIIDDNNISINVNRENIPKIIKKLLDEGYKVYEFKEKELSLEEAFLNKTGGNIID